MFTKTSCAVLSTDAHNDWNSAAAFAFATPSALAWINPRSAAACARYSAAIFGSGDAVALRSSSAAFSSIVLDRNSSTAFADKPISALDFCLSLSCCCKLIVFSCSDSSSFAFASIPALNSFDSRTSNASASCCLIAMYSPDSFCNSACSFVSCAMRSFFAMPDFCTAANSNSTTAC